MTEDNEPGSLVVHLFVNQAGLNQSERHRNDEEDDGDGSAIAGAQEFEALAIERVKQHIRSVAGIALGTAFGAWVNVGTLVISSRRARYLNVLPGFRRSVLPSLLAAAMAGLGAVGGIVLAGYPGLLTGLHGFWHDIATLGVAMLLSGLAYGAAVAVFRKRLPLGRASG